MYELINNKSINNNTNKYINILIIVLLFASFFGAYLKISVISLSNMYSIIIGLIVIRRMLKKRYKCNKYYIFFFFALIFYSFISLLWSNNINEGIKIIASLLTGFTTMAFIASFNVKEIGIFIQGLKLFVIIVLLMSFYEILTGSYIFFNNNLFINRITEYGFHYPGVAFTNPNDLAQFLIFGSTFIVLLKFEEKKLISSFLILFATIIICANAESKLSILTILIVLGVYYLVSLATFIKTALRRIIFSTSIIFLSLIVLYNFGYLDFNLLKIDSSQAYYTERSYLYSNLIRTGIDNLFIGAGLGTSYSVSFTTPHNMILFIFADFGLFWVVSFIILLIFAFLSLFKFKKMTIKGIYYNIITLSILILFPIFSSISSVNEQRKAIWIFLGFVFALINISKNHWRKQND